MKTVTILLIIFLIAVLTLFGIADGKALNGPAEEVEQPVLEELTEPEEEPVTDEGEKLKEQTPPDPLQNNSVKENKDDKSPDEESPKSEPNS